LRAEVFISKLDPTDRRQAILKFSEKEFEKFLNLMSALKGKVESLNISS
jgi:hypothetical protein